MANLPLGKQSYERQYGRMPQIELVNRIFEPNPTNRAEETALLTRPGTRLQKTIGSGRVRRLFWLEGAFNSDVFAVVGQSLWRYDVENDTVVQILGTIQGTGQPDMAVASGPGYQHLFISDGLLFQVYTGTAFGTGTLTLTPDTPPDIDTQTVQIGDVYYQWTTGSVDAGTPDGSSGAPWLVAQGADDEESLANMAAAINLSGTGGTTYSTALVSANTQVTATSDATSLTVTTRTVDPANNTIALGLTGDHLAWGNATIQGSGAETLTGVAMPDGVGARSCATLGGFVCVSQSAAQRIYFVAPGEITIQATDFFAAETVPDEVYALRTVGDRLIVLGSKSIEAWYLTGDTTPGADTFLPVDGLARKIGVVDGSIAELNDQIMFVATDDQAYVMSGNLEPLPQNFGMSERIRRARAALREV